MLVLKSLNKRPDCGYCKKEDVGFMMLGPEWACQDCIKKFYENRDKANRENIAEVIKRGTKSMSDM